MVPDHATRGEKRGFWSGGEIERTKIRREKRRIHMEGQSEQPPRVRRCAIGVTVVLLSQRRVDIAINNWRVTTVKTPSIRDIVLVMSEGTRETRTRAPAERTRNQRHSPKSGLLVLPVPQLVFIELEFPVIHDGANGQLLAPLPDLSGQVDHCVM